MAVTLEDGTDIALPPRLRALLAALLLDAGSVLPAEYLMRCLWGEQLPRSASNALQVHVSQLRRRLGCEASEPGETAGPVLRTKGPGYLLYLGDARSDLQEFMDLVTSARRLRGDGDQAGAVATYRRALAVWRGDPLADVPSDYLARRAQALLNHRLAALEEVVGVELGLGRGKSLVAELTDLVAVHPVREQFVAQLMTALHHAGRTGEALAAFHAARRTLVDQLGVEPGTHLRQVHQHILRGDPVVAPPPAAATAGSGIDLAKPAQLPPDIAGFTGRSGELDLLDGLLASGDASGIVIATVAGTAGVGKTALAVHWAHRVADRFDDGQLYVDLHGYATAPARRPVEVLGQFLRALGVPAERVPQDLDEAAALYRTILSGRRVLVLLDNAASSDQVRPLLPGSSSCLVVVTSRDRLCGLVASEGARAIPLDVLTTGEACALLAKVVGESLPAGPAALREVAEACARLPLALRIAAANLATKPAATIAGYLTDVVNGDRLTVLRVNDGELAVRAAFDMSYCTLPPEAARLFRLLGLVPGQDFTAEAAASLADTAPSPAGRLLDQLANAHLAEQPAPGRYTFHDLLRLYARDRAEADCDEPERSAALARLYHWYLRKTDAAARALYPTVPRVPVPVSRPGRDFAGPSDASGWLEAEWANLVAATLVAVQRGLPAMAWLLPDALRGFYFLNRQDADWQAVAKAARDAGRSAADPAAQASAELCCAAVDLYRARLPAAADRFKRVMALAERSGWHAGHVAALAGHAGVARMIGRPARAIHSLTRALDLCEQAGQTSLQVKLLNNLGGAHMAMGRLERAVGYFHQVIDLHHKTADLISYANAVTCLGEATRELGRLAEAYHHLTRAPSLQKEVGNRTIEAISLAMLAQLYLDTGAYARALSHAQTAVDLANGIDDREAIVTTQAVLATVQQRLGNHREALHGHQAALATARQAGMSELETEALVRLADTCEQQGRYQEAIDHATGALARASDGELRILEGQALTVLAGAARNQTRFRDAIRYAERALAIHRDGKHRRSEARALEVLAEATAEEKGIVAALPQRRELAAVEASLAFTPAT